MLVNLILNDSIHEILESIATGRGLTLEEIIRWIIGDYVTYNTLHRSSPITAVRPLPFPSMENKESTTIEKANKMLEMVLKTTIGQGVVKCPNCTMALNLEAIESGECQHCNSKI